MHRANIDIEYILDPYACCAYIAQYINKSDRSVSDHLSAVLKESIKNQDGSRKVMKKIAAAYYNVSEVSAQEAAYNLLQLRMCEASRKTEFIATGPPEYRKRMLKFKDDLEMLDKNSVDIYKKGLVEYYQARPDELNHLNLAQFVTNYEYYSQKRARKTDGDLDNANDDADNEENPSDGSTFITLREDLGSVKKRKQTKVIRYHLQALDKNPDIYFYSLLMLYLPWKDEVTDLIDVDVANKFEQNKDIILSNRNEFILISDESIEEFLVEAQRQAALDNSEVDEDLTNANERLPNVINPFRASIANENVNNFDNNSNQELQDYELNVSFEDNMITGDELDPDRYITKVDRNTEESSIAQIDRYTRPNRLTSIEFYSLLSKLNMFQRAFLNHVIEHIRHNKEWFAGPAPLKLFVTGGAGTGKSMLIKTLYQALIRHYDDDTNRDFNSPTVLLTAPTGKAAFNINGQIVRSAFHLPVNHSELNELSSEVSHSIGVALVDLKVVIIDEISMISSRLFSWI
ncbi:hypothetical protein A0J61_11176, partial [Choanephora cucurbitarum]